MIHCGISSNILLLADAAVCYYWQQKMLGIRHCSKDKREIILTVCKTAL